MIQVPQIHLPVEATLQNGKYQILRVLGQGGFGITYLAKHKVFGEVALKELFLNSGSALCSRENTTQRNVIPHFKPDQFKMFKDRFLEEAKTLYNLRGVKGVVNVHDIFEENGTVYFSMEYLKGIKLNDYVKARTRLSENEGLEILKTLSLSLIAIHEKNVLHRDIKPSNIIIGPNGEVHLIDFGIAKSYLEEVDETHTTFHSPRYSPPEQKIARSRMGTFSDVYSLGATAYFMFTGKPPQSFEERLLEVEEYKSPKFYVPTISDATNDTIVKSLKLKDRERIQTGEEFLNGLPASTVLNHTIGNAPITTNPPASKIENDKTEVDFDAVEDKTEIVSIDDKTKIVSAPPQKRLKNPIINPTTEEIDERTVISNSPPVQEEDHDRTVIDQGPPLEKKKDWKVWFLRNKKIVLVGLFAFLTSIIWMNIDSPEKPPITESPIPQNYFLNFNVKDAKSQKVLSAKAAIGKNEDILKVNGLNVFSLDITEEWDRFESQPITLRHDKYIDLEINVRDLVNKDTTVYLTPMKDNLIPDPHIFCENISGPWISDNDEKLVIKACVNQDETNNPGGNAVFEDNGAYWSSFKEDEKAYFKLAFIEDTDEVLDFQVVSPYQNEKTKILLKGKNGTMTFKRYIEKPKPPGQKPPKDYNLVGQIYDQEGFTVSDARVYIPNSKFDMHAMNQGRFYFNLTDDWKEIRNQKLIIEHKDFKQRAFKVKDIVNRENYIIRIESKPKSVVPGPITKEEISKDLTAVPSGFCNNINHFWMNDKNGDVLEISGCAGGSRPSGNINLGSSEARWNTSFRGQEVVLGYPISERPRGTIFVRNPASRSNIELLYKGKIFNKRTIKQIFIKNILGMYEDDQGNKLTVKSTNGTSGAGTYNGEAVTFKRSGLTGNGDNASITFRTQNDSYVFDLRNITNRKNTYLKLLTKNGSDLKSKKRTKHIRVR